MLCRNSILPGIGTWFTILHNYTDLTHFQTSIISSSLADNGGLYIGIEVD